MDLESRVKTLEDKIDFLMALLKAKSEMPKLHIDISKFPTKAKSFKNVS